MLCTKQPSSPRADSGLPRGLPPRLGSFYVAVPHVFHHPFGINQDRIKQTKVYRPPGYKLKIPTLPLSPCTVVQNKFHSQMQVQRQGPASWQQSALPVHTCDRCERLRDWGHSWDLGKRREFTMRHALKMWKIIKSFYNKLP